MDPYFTMHETLRERATKPEVPLRNYHSAVKAALFEQAASRGLGQQAASRGLGQQAASRGLGQQAASRGLGQQAASRGLGQQAASRGLGQQAASRGLGQQAASRGLGQQAASRGASEPHARLLDLGAGRGADTRRYSLFRHVTAVDRDPDALRELRRRAVGPVETVWADMTAPLPLKGRQYDAVSAMFCTHYACGDPQTLDAFARNVSAHLRGGGKFVGLHLDGETVARELQACRTRSYRGWAELALADDDAHLDVTIRSISCRPKAEALVMWPTFVRVMTDHGLILDHTEMLDPGTAVRDVELRAFSRLHRSWSFVRVPAP